MTGRGRVVVVGSANADLVLGVERVPRAGETVLADGRRTVPGGKGANQAVAAARDGRDVVFVGAVGRDAPGDLLHDALGEAGVDLARLRRVDQPTGLAVVLLERPAVDGGGADNAIIVEPGANGALELDEGELAAVRTGQVLLVQLEVPLPVVAQALAVARAAGVRTVLNAAPARPLPDALLADVDLLVVNESEAEVLGGAAGLEGARLLLRQVPQVALTLGPRGAVLLTRDRPDDAVPAPPVRPVDTTGAGDTFCGVFAGGLATGAPEHEALVRAVRAASLAVTRAGAVPSIPTAQETDAAGGSPS